MSTENIKPDIFSTLKTRLNLATLGLLAVSSIAMVVCVNYFQKQFALKTADEKSTILLQHNLAIHSYINKRLKPALFTLTDTIREPDYFDSIWMSSTYAVREIDKLYHANTNAGYYYKEAAINARSPENEADEYEREFIQRLNRDASLNKVSGVRDFAGKPFFFTLIRGESMENGCMRCHSTPDKAPGNLVKAYGPQRSFHRSEDEVVSAISIRMPLEQAYSQANDVSVKFSGVIIVFFIVVLFLKNRLITHQVVMPLNRLRLQAESISRDPEHLGETIPQIYAHEINEIAASFNRMSVQLRQHVEDLESAVRNRTASLEESEAKYRQLFENMINGFALHEIVYDSHGNPCDYRFIEINPVFEKLTGLKAADIVGKTVLEVMPSTEHTWIDAYGKVATTGQPLSFENYSRALDRYYQVWAFCPRPGFCATVFSDITESKQSEHKIKRLATLLDESQHIAHIGGWEIDLLTNTLYWTDETYRIHEIDPAEYTPTIESAIAFYDPESLPIIESAVREAIENGKEFNHELELITAKGRRLWVYTTSKVIQDNGKTTKIIGAFQDITERRTLQVELRNLFLEQRTILDASSVGITKVKNRVVVWANRAMAEIFGYSPEEIRNVGTDFFYPSQEEFRRLGEDAYPQLAIGHEYRTELKMRRKGGDLIWILLQGRAINPLNQEEGSVWIFEDISERKQWEQVLTHRLDFLTSPVDSQIPLDFNDLFNLDEIQRIQDAFAMATGVASIITDTNGNPITKPSNFTEFCLNIIRKTPHGLANCHRSDAVLGKGNPDGPTIQTRICGGLLDGGAGIYVGGHHVGNWLVGQVLDETCDLETMMSYAREIGADEEEYRQALAKVNRMPREQFEKVCHALFQITGQLSRMAMQNVRQAQYIADHRQLEEQLRQSQKMEAVGQLAGGIAHDFNNILTVIMGYGNLLSMDGTLTEQQREQVGEIINSSERAAKLTGGLLTFSRKQKLDPQNHNLNVVVQNVQVFISRILGEDIQCRLTLNAADLPVTVDSGQIEQVLINLATNARDAMSNGGTLSIETGMQENTGAIDRAQLNGEPGNYAVIVVSDTGGGMDKETQARIFEPFYTTKEVGKGTGLGMAIVYGIVKQHNGFITVYSEPGMGTTFKIYLPITEKVRSDNDVTSAPDLPQGGSETILLAEDDPNVRNLVVTVLTSFGYKVIQAEDGQQAIEKFSANRDKVGMLLMDMIMPRKNGKEAYDEINRLQPGVKVLYSSGYTADFIQERGFSEEGINLIMKPVHPIELLRKVREVLDA